MYVREKNFHVSCTWYKSLSSTHSNELVNQMDSNLYKMWQWFWERRKSNSKVKGYQVWVLILLERLSPALTVIILCNLKFHATYSFMSLNYGPYIYFVSTYRAGGLNDARTSIKKSLDDGIFCLLLVLKTC